jgi:hypothetical protein
VKKLEATLGIIENPDIDKMTNAQLLNTMIKGIEEDPHESIKSILAAIRGCNPDKVEDLQGLTLEELFIKLENEDATFAHEIMAFWQEERR